MWAWRILYVLLCIIGGLAIGLAVGSIAVLAYNSKYIAEGVVSCLN